MMRRGSDFGILNCAQVAPPTNMLHSPSMNVGNGGELRVMPDA